ncbi:MAG: DGQHR domain-containing protein [Candidatus Bathyarchaeia archaeon]
MRLVLPAIELTQTKDIRVYLTKLSVEQIKDLIENKQLIPDTYNPDINIQQGYQRSLNPNRMRRILNFLESCHSIVLPVMPTSIVLNVRNTASEPLKFKDGKLIIGDDATLYVVDGQHRVWGIKDLKNSKYEAPVTLVYGLDEYQEAAQFLVINGTQKRVDPSLQLRVLFYAEEARVEKLASEIKDVIPWQRWKLEALKIAIKLENDPENPWYKKVKVPNDLSDEWKPIKEGSFVDSFRYLSSEENPISRVPIDKKVAHLKEYWNTIRKLWNKAFEDDYQEDFLLVAPFGAGVFNTLFPSVMTLKNVSNSSFEDLLTPIVKIYPLKKWSRRRGELANRGSNQAAFREVATEFLTTINPSLDYRNHKEYDKIRGMKHNLRWLVDKGYDMLSPIVLKSADYLKDDRGKFKKACYVLVNLMNNGKISVYVGQSRSVENRLRGHSKKYNLYHVESCEDDQEMKQLEGTLWHLVKPSVRENENHPNRDFCPFCE